jgi:hypothetical protein
MNREAGRELQPIEKELKGNPQQGNTPIYYPLTLQSHHAFPSISSASSRHTCNNHSHKDRNRADAASCVIGKEQDKKKKTE